MSWAYPGPHARRVACPTCKARRYRRCWSRGAPVSWHHAARTSRADVVGKQGHLVDPLPVDLPQWLADGMSLGEVAAKIGCSRSTLYRRGIRNPERNPRRAR